MPNFYPFDPAELAKKRRSLRKELLTDGAARLEKKIAVLGGSTTSGIVDMLELFLLWYGIKPEFYQSEYAQYWQDAMFGAELREFKPDFIFIHTSTRNISAFPEMSMTAAEVEQLLQSEISHLTAMWDKLAEDFGVPIIQNNFELPFWRLLGNKDCADFHGRVSFVGRLNSALYDYAAAHRHFYLHDINYLSASVGLEKWSDPLYWNMYKYAVAVPFFPEFAFSLAKIFASLLGRNKKVLALDLDNTLWGGVIGDDGVGGIALGQEVPMGQAFCEFQAYLKAQKQLGVLLTVCSKNDMENALAGLNHPDGVLKPDDFTLIKANWEPKSMNISQTAEELNLLPESIVFVDDNPAERAIVAGMLPVETPPMNSVESYIHTLDKGGYFEVTNFSEDDLKRGEMYRQNAARAAMKQSFADYGEYLDSLEMIADITDFKPHELGRITQLTNKSNQFNLTTKRFTESEMQAVCDSDSFVRLSGRLTDKFGDNGIVSVVIGRQSGDVLHMELWLMSCRVLKRDMELAMLDELVAAARDRGVKTICGYYYKTAKNSMVENLYNSFGFTQIRSDGEDTVWELALDNYQNKNNHILIRRA